MLSATKAAVVCYSKILVNLFEAEALEAKVIGVEVEAVCKYTASTSLV